MVFGGAFVLGVAVTDVSVVELGCEEGGLDEVVCDGEVGHVDGDHIDVGHRDEGGAVPETHTERSHICCQLEKGTGVLKLGLADRVLKHDHQPGERASD